MAALYCTLLIPVLGIILMLLWGHLRVAGTINIVVAAGSLASSVWLAINFWQHDFLLSPGGQFYIDAFSLLAILLTTFVTTTTAIFSKNYMWQSTEGGHISSRHLRLYHTMYQVFSFMMLLTLATNNIGIMWVAMEGATLATVLLVSLYRTPQAIEAAWKYFILCIVGIAFALLGTILIYASSSQLSASGDSAILWKTLYQHAALLNGPLIKLAFVFLLVGYGTKIGLVPLHNWLPDAHSESPAPMSTLLSGLLLNVALYALVRFKILADLALHNNLAGNLMIAFGLLSFVTAAILLHRQHNIKRLFSYSSIEHMGLITFGFGLGGSLATFAAVFYMLMHSLTKAALFVTAGNVMQLTGTGSMDKIRGLIRGNPLIGWSLLIAALAICGFPPFGIFTSELLLIMATFKTMPWLIIILLAGLLIALAGILRHIQPMVFGEATDNLPKFKPNMFAAVLHLILVAIAGVYLPSVLNHLIQQAVSIITK